MGILLWIVFGLLVGVAAKWIMPARDPGGMIVTIALGIVGAITGGMLGAALGFSDVSAFDLRSLLVAIGGALLFLTGYRLISLKMTT